MPQYLERIKGLSDGSMTLLDELLVAQSLEVIANDVSYFLGGCSSICVHPVSLKTPYLILAKNFDYLSDFSEDYLVRESVPKNGYRSLEITYKQLCGCHDGINEKGLVVIYNYGLSVEKTQHRIPITILVQQILERCSNVEEALTFIKTFRYPNAAILTLADKYNNAVCVEITPEHIAVRKPQNGILLATNHFLSSEILPYEIPQNAIFKSKKMPEEFKGKYVHQSSKIRYQRLQELIKKNIFIGVKELEKILKDHHNKDIGDDDTICRHGKLLSTQVGMIFVPRDKLIKVFFNSPCKGNSLEFYIE